MLVATSVEGIFRLSGSEKRIKELKTIFDSPDRYGKGLVWTGYTVHDAANVLRRYLNDLPEPVVPLDLYEKFREPLRGATKQAVGDAEGPQFVENFNEKAAIHKYQQLITELPPLNRQLLLYILDLLAVFAAKSDENRMNSQNLAAIFQPGMLSHPDHAMAPEEYRLNQCVIIFLIENQDHFLIGMQGTAADEKTKKEVEAGTPSGPVTPNPNRKSGLGRTPSNASAGAESVRREGQLRRNRSVSSRNSRHEGSSTPNSPALAATPTGGLGRSNTVPSKKSPALVGGRFQRHDGSSPRSPAHLEPLTQLRVAEVNESERLTLAPGVGTTSQSPTQASTAGRSSERLLDTHQEPPTPSKERKLPSIFQRAPTDTFDKREPNKLKKKRIPGSMNPSAQSSNASFQQLNAASPAYETSNPLEQIYPGSSQIQAQQQHPPAQEGSIKQQPLETQGNSQSQQPSQQQSPPPISAASHPSARSGDISSEITPRASEVSSHQNLHPDTTLKAKKSPPASLHSSFNEGSDIDQVIDEQHFVSTAEQAEKEKKKRWRLSRSRGTDNCASPGQAASPRATLGSNDNADISTVSIGSFSHRPRKSESSEPTAFSGETRGSFDAGKENRDDSKGPIGWIRNKYREVKENAEQRRGLSPPADRQTLSTGFIPRGKSLDIKRDSPPKEAETQKASPPQPIVAAAPTVSPIPAPVPIPVPAAVAVPLPALGQTTPPTMPQRPRTPPPQQSQPLQQPPVTQPEQKQQTQPAQGQSSPRKQE